MTAKKKRKYRKSKRVSESATQKEVNQAVFLKAFLVTKTIESARKVAGVSRACIYNWRRDDPDFMLAFTNAVEAIADGIEGVMYDKAMEGNPTLIIFALKSLRPKVYREQYSHIISGDADNPIVVSLTTMSDDDVAREIEQLESELGEDK